MLGFARRIVVGISGSSGPIYGIRTLEALRAEGCIDEIINHSVGKALDVMSVPHGLFCAWEGPAE